MLSKNAIIFVFLAGEWNWSVGRVGRKKINQTGPAAILSNSQEIIEIVILSHLLAKTSKSFLAIKTEPQPETQLKKAILIKFHQTKEPQMIPAGIGIKTINL